MSRVLTPERLLDSGISPAALTHAWAKTDAFLVSLPAQFGMSTVGFYTVLNQRNLSGLIGEIFKHALHRKSPKLVPNPHPDGRPDLLDLRSKLAVQYFTNECTEEHTGAPIRRHLAPFKFGGVEVKCTLGKVRNASAFAIGESRVSSVTDITYWAHHQHECLLLGLYYDFDEAKNGSPQLKAVFMAELSVDDWAAVSTGRAEKKKTSNTSLLKHGRDNVKRGLVGYDSSSKYEEMLRRIGAAV